jgi:hypothetical protein
VSDYEADDERNHRDHNGGDQEKTEQYAPTCEGHDVSFRVKRMMSAIAVAVVTRNLGV